MHERTADHVFDARVTYATRTATVDVTSGEVRTKAIAIQTQGVQSLRTAALEMEAVAETNTRLRESANVHLALSWRAGEHPTPEQAFEAGRMALAALGAADHQYVMALHVDTENDHLHIVFNRVHPDTFRALDMYRDYEKLDRACRQIELTQGWSLEQSAKAMHHVENGAIARVYRERHPDGPAPLGARGDTARAQGDQTLFTEWVRGVGPELKAYLSTPNPTWVGVHAKLAEFNLRLEPKNGGRTAGLIVIDRDDPTRVAQAGQIAHFARRGKLEAVLGPFEPDEHRTLEPDAPMLDSGGAGASETERRDAQTGEPAPSLDDIGQADANRAASLAGYGRYLVEDDERRRAQRGAELAANPRLLIDDLFSRNATVTSTEIARAIVRDVANDDQARSVWAGLDALVACGELVALDATLAVGADAVTEMPGQRWTTPEMLARETELRSTIDVLAAAPPQAALGVAADEIDALGLRPAQRAAVERIISGERLVPIIGHAGVGKSYVFKRAVELTRQHAPERTQLGLAQGGQAAAELAESTGIRSMTIAAFARAVRAGELTVDAQTDLILDEANLVGTADMYDVVTIVRDAGARLFVAGDTSQLPAVAAGGAFGMMTQRVPSMSLDEVVRQTGWRLAAAEHARSGATIAHAVTLYAKHGSLYQPETRSAAIEQAVKLWLERSEPYSARLLLAFRNDDVDALNSEARERLRERGAIGDGIWITTKRYAELEIGIGDRVIFRRNEYTELDVRNGMLGTVVAFESGSLRVRIDGSVGREVVINPASYNDLGYGYALASYAGEGKTADYSVAYLTRADFQASAYVALSRSRGDCDVVIAQDEFTFARRPGGEQNHAANLAFLLCRERVKDLATSYERNIAPEPLRVPTAGEAPRYTMQPSAADTSTIRRQTGQRRFDQWFAREVGADLRSALTDPQRSWSRVHAVLEANAVTTIRTGRGLVYADAADVRWRCKASALPKRFALAELEKQLGPYERPETTLPADRAYAEDVRDRRLAAPREPQAARHGPERGRSHATDRARETANRAQRDPRYAQFVEERDRRLTRSAAWSCQRATERDRHGEIARDKRAIKADLLARGYAARTADAIATAHAYEEREALRAAIAEERAALLATLGNGRAESWREFLERVADTGPDKREPTHDEPHRGTDADRGPVQTDPAPDEAQSRERVDAAEPTDPPNTPPASGEGQKERRADRDDPAAPEPDGPTIESAQPRDPQRREAPGLRHRVYENGDVGYRFNDIQSRVFGGDAFRDRGSRITLEDNSERSIRAAVGYAKERFGREPVTLRVNPKEQERVLRAAVKAGLTIKNPELQAEVARIRAGQAKDVFASIEREPNGKGDRGRGR